MSSLATDNVEVWTAALNPPPAAGLSGILSPDELARAACFVSPRDRDRFVAGRAFLRLLLGRRLGRMPADLRFGYGIHGKPDLVGADVDIHFNLAHSGDLAICALARSGPVGIDVETVKPLADLGRVARASFTATELERFESLPGPRQLRTFYEIWTLKEAFLKALGTGLGRRLDSFDVAFGPDEPPRLLRSAVDPEEVTRFSLLSFVPRHGHVAAIAVARPDVRARHSTWCWN